MFVIFEGRYSDWEPKGYVDSEEVAQSICAEHNVEFWGGITGDKYCSNEWYYLEVKPFNTDEYDTDTPTYELVDVVFNDKNECCKYERLETYVKVKEEPKVIQEDKYCTVIRLRVKPKTDGEKILKIAKDYLMQYKAEEVNGCTGCGFASYATQDECEECLSWKKKA